MFLAALANILQSVVATVANVPKRAAQCVNNNDGVSGCDHHVHICLYTPHFQQTHQL